MGCEVVKIGDVRAIVCGRDRRRSKRCKCGAIADRQCDWKVKGKRSGTCDAWVCQACSVEPAPGKDLCTAHAAAWLEWQKAKKVADGEAQVQAEK